MAQSEVGPNDIVIHLVNPYKCGDCGSEFCLRSLFLDHLAEHIDLLKSATPCHQIVCATSLVEQQPGSITVTRDILQINEQQMFELQDVSLDYTQLTPLKVLEQAGILSLPRPLPVLVPIALTKENPIVLDMRDTRTAGRKISLLKNQHLQEGSSGLHVKVLNTSNKLNSDASQRNVPHLEANDPCTSELDSLVQQALFGDGRFKGECRITVSSPVHLTEVISADSKSADFNCIDTKPILGMGKSVHSMKEKGYNNGVICLLCSNVFANASVLERHQVVHTGAKPYTCNICFKVFNDISTHRKHTLIHKRQQRCPVCHRMYMRRTQLLLHMKQHKKKRFIQFGNNFYEVQVNVTRNSDGQLVQEYHLPLLATLEASDKSIDVSKEDQIHIKEEYNEALTGMKASIAQTQEIVTDISDLTRAQENDNTVVSNALKNAEQVDPEQKKKVIYRCGHCKLMIFTRPTLSRHLIKHTNTRPFQCEKCLKSFHDKADLLHHYKTHTKPVQCKTCLSSFSKVLYLQNHLLKGCPVTDNDSRFTLLPDLRCQCNICQKILKNKSNVLRHIRVHAFQDRTKSSDQEGETTVSPVKPENLQSSELEHLSQNLEDHFHPLPNSVGYRCLICSQEFRFKSFIITHVRMHLNQRPYKCTDCPKSFYARQLLKKHQQNHTRPYKCPACNKSFIRRYLMKDHFKKRHEQEDPLKDITELLDEKLIQCDICGKTMKSFQKSVMLSHIRLHKDVRPFECKVCHKTFISDNAVRKHSLNHTRPYKCNICNEGFSRRYFLTDHFKKKCGRRKQGNSELNGGDDVPKEETQESQINKVDEDLPSSSIDASTECRPYEAQITSEHDPTTSSTTYTCQPCDKRFTVYDSLVRHINTFSKPTPCKYCKMVFEDKHLTLSHQRSCLGPSLSPLKKFSKKSKTLGEQQEKVQKIMKDIHRKIETLTSETSSTEVSKDNIATTSICIKSHQTSLWNLSDHSQIEHASTPTTRTLNILKEEKGKITCPECDRGFDTPRGLKIHASSHVRLFKCEVCEKDFTQISNLRSHAKIHKIGVEAGSKSEPETSSKFAKKNGEQIEFGVQKEERKDVDGEVKNLKKEQVGSVKMLASGKRRRGKISDGGNDSDDDLVAEMNLGHKDLLDVTHRLMQSGTRGRPYSCKMCRRRFTEECGLTAHMLQNHGVRA